MTSYELQLCEERVVLLPERALFIPRLNTVYIADTHWGKAATFRHYALPVPEGSMKDDLERLSTVIEQTQARRLVILGDLIHARAGWTSEIIRQLKTWRDGQPELSILLVRGNHDRGAGDPPPELTIETIAPPVSEPPFVLQHQPETSTEGYGLAGHIHPALLLEGKGKQSMKLPCFIFGKAYGVLPAFGSFTGGAIITPQLNEQVYVVAGNAVIPVKR